MATQREIGDERPGRGKRPRSAGPPPDAAENAWDQDFVTHYSEVLVPLAKEGLKQLQSLPATPPAAPPQTAQGRPGRQCRGVQKQRAKA